MRYGIVPVAAACAVVSACGYDFDAPFSESWHGQADASAGGESGVGGAAGKAGAAGQGGAAGHAGAAGQGGAAGLGGAAGQGGGGAEDCTNGADDNSDGLVDCADPLCTQGFTCVPTAVAGWSKPGFQRQYAGSAAPGQCSPGATRTTVFSGLQTSPSDTCTCDCATPQGACAFDVQMYGGGLCAGGMHHFTNPLCTDAAGDDSFRGSAQLVGATCAVTTAPSLTAASWLIARDFCEAPAAGAGCGAGMSCVPKPLDGFGSNACVEREGDVECPPGYPSKYNAYQSFSDTRACAAGSCTCDPPTGGSCTATLSQYEDSSCTAVSGPALPLDSSCQHMTNPNFVQVETLAILGSCASSGAAIVTGQATPTGGVTLCCVGP